MKKLLKGLLLSGLIASSVYGAKVATADEFGRLYNTSYYDTIVASESPILDIITYSKRVGTFDWSKLTQSVDNLKASKATIKIQTRVEIPNSIKTSEAYFTLGKNYRLLVATWPGNIRYGKRESDETLLFLKTFLNDKEQKSSDIMLGKVKVDSFGSRYIDLKIVIDLEYGTRNYPYIHGINAIQKKLNSIKIKVAPKSRTFQSKWVEPKIYVMDE